jgi:hypothetical protein
LLRYLAEIADMIGVEMRQQHGVDLRRREFAWASLTHAAGPVSMITTWPPAMIAVQLSARFGSGIGEPVPQSRICKVSSLNTAALSALAI